MIQRKYTFVTVIAIIVFIAVGVVAVFAHSFSPPADLSHDMEAIENQHVSTNDAVKEENANVNAVDSPQENGGEESSTNANTSTERTQTNTAIPTASEEDATPEVTNANTNTETESPPPKSIAVSMHVVPVGSPVQDYTITTTDGDSIYDVMVLAEKSGFTFVEKDFPGIGKYISTILGLKEDKHAGFYWTLYLNGTYSSVGVSDAVVHDGDKVMWKYERK